MIWDLDAKYLDVQCERLHLPLAGEDSESTTGLVGLFLERYEGPMMMMMMMMIKWIMDMCVA